MEQKIRKDCYRSMKDLRFILLISLGFLLFTVLMPSLDFSLNLIAIFFIIGNLLFVLATYSILKFGKASTKEFDKGEWYEDLK